ncbi:hypothetical protein P4B35_01130 [Pontiellaceae bacterium B12227]|nr:hypothetical protein [Pontiellaceae bacterium B12227]
MRVRLFILATVCMLSLSLRAEVVKAWKFNASGNTESWSAFQHMTGLTVSNAINGDESVLTSVDITGNDPSVRYNNGGADSALWLSPGETGWGTIELRIRLLDTNPGVAGVASKDWPDPAAGTLVFINQGLANGLNTGAIDAANGWTIVSQSDNWMVASFDISSLDASVIKSVRIDPVAHETTGNFEIDSIQLKAVGVEPPQMGSDNVVKLLFPDQDPLDELMLVQRSSLTTGEWSLVTFSTNGLEGFTHTHLSDAALENGMRVLYVPSVANADFYSFDTTPLSNWFGVVATSNPRTTTHNLVSGAMTVGISDLGGGYINKIELPGIGDVMGVQADKYGRGGQSAIRDSLHGSRYNPTQAGFSDPAGTICRVSVAQDGSALVVPNRPCCLFRGDGQFDFTEWENLADDRYTESGGSNDWDTIDEGLLAGKQATEVTSEFDYYCTYENLLGTRGTTYGTTNAITISTVRHYYEYRYVREPGHCLLQHNLGPLYDPVAGAVTDISVANPVGIQAATSNDMGVLRYAMSIRMDIAVWSPTYLGTLSGNDIGDLSFGARTGAVTARQFHEDGALAVRAPAYSLPSYASVSVPLMIYADSTDIDQGGALALYYPNSTVNEFSIIGVDRTSGAVLYEEDRRLHMELRDSPTRTPTMQWCGFRGDLLGVLNPLRLPASQYEALRGEFYILYGSPREIFENAQRIQPF